MDAEPIQTPASKRKQKPTKDSSQITISDSHKPFPRKRRKYEPEDHSAVSMQRASAYVMLLLLLLSSVFMISVITIDYYRNPDNKIPKNNLSAIRSEETIHPSVKDLSQTQEFNNRILSRSEMIEYVMRKTYSASCIVASASSVEIQKMPLSQCIDYLMKTQGEALRTKTNQFSEAEIYKFYLEMKEQ